MVCRTGAIEEQYKYVSESYTDIEDEDWTLGPKKMKRIDTIAVSTGKEIQTK